MPAVTDSRPAVGIAPPGYRLPDATRLGAVRLQVSDLARLEVELYEERNPANPDSQVAEVTLALKGVTLRAKEATREMDHSINLVSEEIARQGGTLDKYIGDAVMAFFEGADHPERGFRAALALSRALDQAARQAQRDGRNEPPQWGTEDLN